MREARLACAQHRRAQDRSLQPDGGVVDHDELRALDQLVRTQRFLRADEDHVRFLLDFAAGHPSLDRLAAGLAEARLIRVGADDEESLRVRADDIQRHVEPGEHIFKDRVGVRLAGVEDDVGKDGNDLLEPRGLRQKRLVQSLHVRPEFDARHREVALKPLGEIRVEFGVLGVVHLERVGDRDRVDGRFAVGEKGGGGLQSHLVGDDADAALARQVRGGRFGEELSVEEHHHARLRLIEEGGEFLRHIPRGQDVLTQEIARRLVVGQVVDAENPAQAGETERAEGDGFVFKIHQLGEGELRDAGGELQVAVVGEPGDVGVIGNWGLVIGNASIKRSRLVDAGFTRHILARIVAVGAEDAFAQAGVAREIRDGYSFEPQRPRCQQVKAGIPGEIVKAGGGFKERDGLARWGWGEADDASRRGRDLEIVESADESAQNSLSKKIFEHKITTKRTFSEMLAG